MSTRCSAFGQPGPRQHRQGWYGIPLAAPILSTFNQNFISDYTFGTIRNRAVIGARLRSIQIRCHLSQVLRKIIRRGGLPDLFDVVSVDGQSPKMPNFTKANVLEAFATRATAPFVSPDKYNTFSAYLNNVTNLTNYLILSAGLRVDHYRNILDDEDQTALSPKFGFDRYADQRQALRSSPIIRTVSRTNSEEINNKAFKPEQAISNRARCKIQSLQ